MIGQEETVSRFENEQEAWFASDDPMAKVLSAMPTGDTIKRIVRRMAHFAGFVIDETMRTERVTVHTDWELYSRWCATDGAGYADATPGARLRAYFDSVKV